jgi:hypothetical protein
MWLPRDDGGGVVCTRERRLQQMACSDVVIHHGGIQLPRKACVDHNLTQFLANSWKTAEGGSRTRRHVEQDTMIPGGFQKRVDPSDERFGV